MSCTDYALHDCSGQLHRGVLSDALGLVQQRLLDQRLLSDEYRNLLERDRLINHTVRDSKLPANGPKNRYVNVLPYDHNRVRLASQGNYINASFVGVNDVMSTQEFNYIATQGPLPATTTDFWRMVLQKRTPAIVMLTNTTERGMIKCAQYFPSKEGEVMSLKGLDVTALSVSVVDGGQLTIRLVQVLDTQTRDSWNVKHFHYQQWPDHGTPEESLPIRNICEDLQHARSMEQKEPVVVHCSAGIGRTGTFVAVDILRQRLKKLAEAGSCTPAQLAEALNLPALVHELRQQRMGMVQTFEQYAFIYQALYEELRAALQQ